MKRITPNSFALCLVIVGFAGTVSAQNDLNLPDVSQAAEVKQRLALTDITVKYHRPLVNGRKIWGGLVPYGKVWRAGANENTTIEFSDPVSVEGQTLAKGIYGLQNIRAQLKGRGQFTWQALDEGAQFCLTRKINLDEALRWADASIQNEERFDNLSTKADILKALNRPDEAKATWSHAVEIATAPQLYSYGRRLQSQKQGAKPMEIFQQVAKRFPQGVYGDLARARIKSAAGDFAGAASDAKKAQAAAPTDAQKQSIKALIDRLEAKQDINK